MSASKQREPEPPLQHVLDAIDWLWEERIITLDEHRKLRAPVVARNQQWWAEYLWAHRERGR